MIDTVKRIDEERIMKGRIKLYLQLIGWFTVLAFILWIPELSVVMFPFMIGWWIWKKVRHR